MSDQKAITDAEAITRFLNDPVIKGAIERLHTKYYQEFRAPNRTPADREMTFAKSKALDDFAVELMAVQGAGVAAKARVADEERRQSQRTRQR